MKKTAAFLLLVGLIFSFQARAETAFYYTSSPNGYVGAGETRLITTEDFRFVAIGAAESGVQFTIDNWRPGSSDSLFEAFYLVFAAPIGEVMVPGEYLDAVRSPFEPMTNPALEFAANGRGNNQVTGSFTVLEANFGPGAEVLSFAADFIQYDEGVLHKWSVGQIRYNSNISMVPEPSSGVLFLMGLIGSVVAFRRKQFLVTPRAESIA